MSASADIAWYVYAVLPADAQVPRCGHAILCGAALTMITADSCRLAALVSPVPHAQFAATDGTASVNDPDWVAARVAAHHAVVCAAAAGGPCLPLGFGTLFSAPEAARAWLTAQAASLNRALTDLADREEWSVFLAEDAEAHAVWLARSNADLLALREAAQAATPGIAFLMARRLGKAIQTARAAHGREVAAVIAAALARLACESRADTAREGSVAAWCVLAETNFELKAAIAEMARPLQGTGLTVRASGPFPPYIFARAALAQLQNAA